MIEEYRKARKLGRGEVARALAAGDHPFPVALDELLQGVPPAREASLGNMEIPLSLVVGTRARGRQNVFSRGFMPLADDDTEFAGKWSRLYDAQVAEGFRDPIVVVECLQRFYVQEGNKRVSVARYLGMPSIMAQVTRVVPYPGMGMDEELVRYEEFERFYAVAPMYDITLSHKGDYARLARVLGKDLSAPWPEDDVRRLRSAFYAFASAYEQRGGSRLACGASDAFLLYVQAYAGDDVGYASPATMRKRVGHLWDEFVVASQPDPIAFVSEPSSAKTGVVSKAVSKVKPKKPLAAAFVYDRKPSASGWVALHKRAEQDLARRMGKELRMLSFEGCATQESFDAAVREAVAAGCSVVFTASPRQMAQARRAAVAHPGCGFLNCSVNQSSSAVRTYYARMYEVKFLMGALAASMSRSHQLGYVAFSPINGAVSEVNAFALGASLVDPYATVHLKWLSASPGWRDEMLDAGVDVICDRDFVDPAAPDEPVGLYVVADGTILPVAQPVWDWARYYELILRGMMAGSDRAEARTLKGRAINYWWGMRAGVVRIQTSDGIALGQKRLVEMLGRSMLDGQLAPFDALLVDQAGTVIREADGAALTDEQIASMSWLNINVAGKLPSADELSVEGKADVEAAGVVSPGSAGA